MKRYFLRFALLTRASVLTAYAAAPVFFEQKVMPFVNGALPGMPQRRQPSGVLFI
jgi:hypothetical protein